MQQRGAILLVAVLATAAVVSASSDPLLLETFAPGWDKRWIHSTQDKYEGKFEWTSPEGFGDQAIRVPEKSKHYGLTSLLPQPLKPSEGLVLQYEVKFADGHTCGGGYLKLLTHKDGFRASQLKDDTPYSVMFGPDKCGAAGKVHLILRHTNPVSGKTEEHHLVNPPQPPNDQLDHIYTLVITPDNKFKVLIDGEVKKEGSLMDSFEPPFQPPKDIPDPEDKKPEDWIDDPQMVDPNDKKPEDWDDRRQVPDENATMPEGWQEDEPASVPDPNASAPEDWDEEEDGEWSAPLVANPKCKVGCGKWERPMVTNPAYKGAWMPKRIDNPDYKGQWVQKTIPNPEYFEEDAPLAKVGDIGAVAIEIWTVDQGYVFDGILVDSKEGAALRYREEVWAPRFEKEKKLRDAAVEKAKPSSGYMDLPTRLIRQALSQPVLASMQPYLKPGLDALDKAPFLGWVAFGFPLALAALTILWSMLSGKNKRQKDSVGAAKKADTTGPDDEDEDEEEEKEAAEQAAAAAAKKPRAAAKKAAEQEIEEDAEEEEEEEQETKVKRRTRRA